VKPLLLYDADCAFCMRVARLVPVLRLKVKVRAMQSVDLDGAGVSPVRAVAELPLVRADGTVVYGHEAVAVALATGPGPLRWVAKLLVARWCDSFFRRVYLTVARHRHQLPGGTDACALPPAI
jgi:predicted DCC family thiol-disulfide oxidoreductase YuxK